MDNTEQVRFKCLQARRTCQRGLLHAKTIVGQPGFNPAQRAKLRQNIGYFETCILLTKPAWVKQATLDDLMPVLQHLSRVQRH